MSNEVSDFLRSVEQLKDRRDSEDEARSRELEQKILQERRERQARREERARSISPQKSSPANTPPPPSSHRYTASQVSDGLNLASSPVFDGPGSPKYSANRSPRPTSDETNSQSDGNMESTSPSTENEAPFDADSKRSSVNSSAVPGRTTTLSWQRRPASQASERPRSRPLSIVAAENAAVRSSATPTASSDLGSSKDQIAQALGAKDPAWFRQTADRGVHSAAYRRNQVEDEERLDMSSMRAQLPGMSRALPEEPTEELPASPTSDMPQTYGRLGNSHMQLTSDQKLDPPTTEELADAAPPGQARKPGVMSPPSGRSSPTRPRSPTKGMGGFVQSAMMKRSDSVKRWSVTSPIGFQRPDSAASNRDSLQSIPRSTPWHANAHARTGSTSRPTSSQGRDPTSPTLEIVTDEKGAAGEKTGDDGKTTPPMSPSRTMDPRRWSPTKASSWLEAALNKPESPKPKPTPSMSTQPSWMVELNKAKAQRANNPETEPERTPSVAHKHEVKTGGLMRSSPMGSSVKPTGLGRLNSPITSPPATGPKPTMANFRGGLPKSSPNPSIENPEAGEEENADTEAPLSAPHIKPKPETPPKKDFRANLKPRQPPATASSQQPAEFQNVFGSLRRTTTQNYVAPDELKHNILQGKAALNATGGPKKAEAKDEFKEAILAKKGEFQKAKQEGRSVTRSTDAAADKPVAEGLAKVLKPSKTGQKDSVAPYMQLDAPVRQSNPGQTSTIAVASRPESRALKSPGLAKENGASVRLALLQRETSAPARMQAKPGGGGLADRFNPALAGLLAGGPPPMASGGSRSPDPSKSSGGDGTGDAAADDTPGGAGPQLTHMTKNRARGPRRKAPSSAPQAIQPVDEKKASTPQRTSRPSLSSPKPDEMATSQPMKSRPLLPDKAASPKPQVSPKPQGFSAGGDPVRKSAIEQRLPSSSRTPPADSSRPLSSAGSSMNILEQVAALAARGQQSESQLKEEPSEAISSQPPSPSKLDTKRMSRFMDGSNDQKQEADRMRSPSPQKTVTQALPEPVGLGIQMRPAADEKVDSEPVVSVRNGAAMFGGPTAKRRPAPLEGVSAAPSSQRPRSPAKSSSSSARPVPSAAPSASAGPLESPPPISTPTRSPAKYRSEVAALLNDFFGEERPGRDYRVDAAELLMKRPQTRPRAQTQTCQRFQVSGDGKKVPVPSHYERVLFEREMYICPHTFVNEAGKQATEVYFWAGDEVPRSSIEGAHVFLQREARSFGGKLVKLTQGSETPEFLQGLGGVVIVRRGSSNKYDSLAPNMLCGRRYLGEVVFDEVDFSPASLCSGFPYLIAFQGKCHLWKGKGSDVDELSCARLVGMDLTLMGELLEVEDGAEPASFWDVFDGGKRPGSADHWRLKPNYDRYCGRLFCSDSSSRQQIFEIHPFSQADLQATGIYVLDAFFELYIIVGHESSSSGSSTSAAYASFHNALDFAQEYAILSASVEDRPFVPVSTVVLEGVPRDLRSVFRKWRDGRGPTRGSRPGHAQQQQQASPNLKRGRSLRVVPLGQALQALTE